MAGCRFTAEEDVELLQQEPDEDEEAICTDPESDISDDDDPEYLPQDPAGVVGVSGNPAFLHEEESSQDSEDSSDESSEEEAQTKSNRLSKKGLYWDENPPAHGRTRSHNILRSCPGPRPGSTAVSPKDAWDLFMSNNIIEEVLKCTNLEGRRIAATAKGKEWRNIDKEEFMAFIGLTLIAGGEKSCHVALRELFLDPLQNPIYKATMALKRYEDIRRVIQFDDKRTRALRLETDHMAAFRYVWDCFTGQLQKTVHPQ